MAVSEPRSPFPVARSIVPAIALDAAFDARWASWVARGRAEEQRTRRKVVVWTYVAATAALFYLLLR